MFNDLWRKFVEFSLRNRYPAVSSATGALNMELCCHHCIRKSTRYGHWLYIVYQRTTRRCSGEYFKWVNFYGKRQHSLKVKYWSSSCWRKNIWMRHNFLWNSIIASAKDFSYSFLHGWMSFVFVSIFQRGPHVSKRDLAMIGPHTPL